MGCIIICEFTIEKLESKESRVMHCDMFCACI